MLPKRFFFILYTTHWGAPILILESHHWITVPAHIDHVFLQFFGYYPHTIPLLLVCTTTEQLAASPTISICTPSILSLTQTTLQPFSFSSYLPSSLPLPVTVPTFKLPTLTQQPSKFRIKTTFMATKYSQPQTENREENNVHLFTGSIMDPFKTRQTGLFATALVSLSKSGRFHLVWYQNRPQSQTG